MLKRIFLSLMVVFIAAIYSQAQVTTSSISGTVKDATTKEPLVGATIIATHQPTGTRYTTVSRAGGEYAISNMRPGGPYLIQISFVGFDLEKSGRNLFKACRKFRCE